MIPFVNALDLAHPLWLLGLTLAVGFFMAAGIGANDVANAMGTAVGSKALTLRQAILYGAVAEALGALLASGQVTNTIRHGLLDIHALDAHPTTFALGMLAALLAATSWLVIATRFRWPVSTTHGIIGAIIGFACYALGWHHVNWWAVGHVATSWVITPLIAGVLAYTLFRQIQQRVFRGNHPTQAALLVGGSVAAVMAVTLTITLRFGLPSLGVHLSNASLLAAIGVPSLCIGLWFARSMRQPLATVGALSNAEDFDRIEQAFGQLAILTACTMAFGHGANDVANANGPLSAIINVMQHGNLYNMQEPIPLWIVWMGAVGVVLGLATFGYRVIETIGQNITPLTPTRAFSAQFATALTILVASGLGLPVSTTQTLVGAVLGVGMARGISALNLGVVRSILRSWMITLPAGASFAVVYYIALSHLFHVGT